MTSGLWYQAALRDDWIVEGPVSAIRDHFADAVEAAGWPDGACLFVTSRDARPGRAHDTLFFSPASVSVVPHLIAVCGAKPGPPPERACAMLLVGKPTDWDLLRRETH